MDEIGESAGHDLYGTKRIAVDLSVERVLATLLPEALNREGFEILSRVDLDPHLLGKLGLSMRRHSILGVCDRCNRPGESPSAGALGLLLQCNLTVYRENGRTVVGLVRPTAALEAVNGEGLREVAEGLEQRLVRVLAHLSRAGRSGAQRGPRLSPPRDTPSPIG